MINSKYLSKITILSITSLIFLSCNKEELKTSNPNENYKIQAKENYKSHLFTIEDKTVSIKEENGQFYLSDCEILTNEQMNILNKLSNNSISTSERAAVTKEFTRLWPKGEIYYTTEGISTSKRKEAIATAMKDMENKTGLTFIPRTNQVNYIYFKDHPTANNSSIGMIGGKQIINLARNNVATVQHEIMHSLGIYHEQCRPDRDKYIKYNSKNVIAGYEHNFNTFNNILGLRAFDFESIMLYGSNSWSKNGEPVLTRYDGTTWLGTELAKNSRMSKGDIEGIKYLYQSSGMKATLSTSKMVTFISPTNNNAIDLNAANTTQGNPIILYSLNNRNNQNWKFVSAGNGEYYIVSSINANKVIGVKNERISNGAILTIKNKNTNSIDQKWKIYYSQDPNNGFIRISPASNPNLAITANGVTNSNIRLNSINGTRLNNQRFRLLYHEN